MDEYYDSPRIKGREFRANEPNLKNEGREPVNKPENKTEEKHPE